jgi:hypothetical protein
MVYFSYFFSHYEINEKKFLNWENTNTNLPTFLIFEKEKL